MRKEGEAEALRKANAARAGAQKKAATNAAGAALLKAHWACQGACVCEGAVCAVGGLFLCPYCGTLEKCACQVASCLAAKAAEGAGVAEGEQGDEEGTPEAALEHACV